MGLYWKNRIKDNLTNWISIGRLGAWFIVYEQSAARVLCVTYAVCIYKYNAKKKKKKNPKDTFSDSWSPSWSNPIRHWKGWRQLQNGDVPGGIQRSLLQPAGIKWCPSLPENVWTLYMLKLGINLKGWWWQWPKRHQGKSVSCAYQTQRSSSHGNSVRQSKNKGCHIVPADVFLCRAVKGCDDAGGGGSLRVERHRGPSERL